MNSNDDTKEWARAAVAQLLDKLERLLREGVWL
jgi:hypothetical protein